MNNVILFTGLIVLLPFVLSVELCGLEDHNSDLYKITDDYGRCITDSLTPFFEVNPAKAWRCNSGYKIDCLLLNDTKYCSYTNDFLYPFRAGLCVDVDCDVESSDLIPGADIEGCI